MSRLPWLSSIFKRESLYLWNRAYPLGGPDPDCRRVAPWDRIWRQWHAEFYEEINQDSYESAAWFSMEISLGRSGNQMFALSWNYQGKRAAENLNLLPWEFIFRQRFKGLSESLPVWRWSAKSSTRFSYYFWSKRIKIMAPSRKLMSIFVTMIWKLIRLSPAWAMKPSDVQDFEKSIRHSSARRFQGTMSSLGGLFME